MKFIHIADTHIKNLKFHTEYRSVFNHLYETLREEKPDYIVHCGDLAHTKTQISPEFVEMCANFLNSLADIAPTYVILGNHDGNLRNAKRQDAITPVVQALDHPDLHLLKNSGEVKLKDNFTLNVLSIFDEENWVNPSDKDKINIALYHGAISNCQTDTGWVLERGDHNISVFKEFDYAFLGDIHKTDQQLDKKGKIRYAGSTVQQNHGETNDKGFLIWEIENKNKYTCRHVELKNPKPFITIELTPTGKVPSKTKVPDGSRIRLVSNNNLSVDVLRRAVDVAKSRFKPETVTFLNRAIGERGEIDELSDDLMNEDLRDPAIQEELIEEYLKDYQADSGTMDKVFALNRKFNAVIEEKEEVGRNINWKLNSIEWDNLFNYDEENSIDFTKLSGIVGIFGKNFSGKSSIIDSLLFTLYNSTSKNERKNLNIINQNKDNGLGRVNISIGNKQYTVERTSDKYVKKLKGEETTEAKTDVEFTCYDPVLDTTNSLNDISRNETDKSIRKLFGTMDDFLLTSMSSQLDSLAFINEGSTKRKEILAKFLDLEIFDKKFKLAKDEASDLRGALKRLEGREFTDEVFEAEKEIIFNERDTREHKEQCENLKKEISEKERALSELNDIIDSIPTELIDITAVLLRLDKLESGYGERLDKEETLIQTLAAKEELLGKISIFLSSFDAEDVQEKQSLIESKQEDLRFIQNEIKQHETMIKVQENKACLLQEVPCGSEFSHCKFIKDAYEAVDVLSLVERKKADCIDNEEEINNQINDLEPEKVIEHLNKYDELVGKRAKLSSEITQTKLQIETNKNEYNDLLKNIENLKEKQESYEKNKEAIENKGSFIKKQKKIKQAIQGIEETLEVCEEEMLELYKSHGSAEQKLEHLKEQQQELVDLREEYAAYDLFMRCMHSGGISYDIIKKKLPVINEEIAKVLATVVNFEVFLDDDGKRLNMFIKHAKYDPRPLAMGSGAEKTIAAMAIRLALLSVSSLPKSDIFILDEPGTALDEENMEGFVRILELIKSYFKTVLLISHLDSLKDCVDMQISIEEREGYAHVEI